MTEPVSFVAVAGQPSARALRAFPITCPVCAAEPGEGCRNAWGRLVHYQHKARKR